MCSIVTRDKEARPFPAIVFQKSCTASAGAFQDRVVLPRKLFVAPWLSVIDAVFSPTGADNEVAGIVIAGSSIVMVDFLFSDKRSSESFLRLDPVFIGVTSTISEGVALADEDEHV